MKKGHRNIAFLFLALVFLVTLLYFLFVRSLVAEAYLGEAPQWFNKLVSLAYPRFEVEKQRFELDFFQYKADQIIIRFSLILVTLAILILRFSVKKLVDTCSISHNKSHFHALRYIFYLGLLFYTWDWYNDFSQIVRMQAFYKGVHIFRLTGIGILRLEIYYLLFAAYLLSITMVLLDIKKIWFSTFTVLLLIFFQGYLFSFEKIEHSYTTLTYAAMLMPCLFYELEKQPDANDTSSSFMLFLIQLSISSAYFLSGIEKLLSSGFSWASAETFRTYIYLHQQETGLWVASNDILAHILPWGALIFQLLFILTAFSRTSRLILLPMGVGFHWGTRLLMGIGSYFSPWIFVYVFFVDWEKIVSSGVRKIRKIKNTKNGM